MSHGNTKHGRRGRGGQAGTIWAGTVGKTAWQAGCNRDRKRESGRGMASRIEAGRAKRVESRLGKSEQ